MKKSNRRQRGSQFSHRVIASRKYFFPYNLRIEIHGHKIIFLLFSSTKMMYKYERRIKFALSKNSDYWLHPSFTSKMYIPNGRCVPLMWMFTKSNMQYCQNNRFIQLQELTALLQRLITEKNVQLDDSICKDCFSHLTSRFDVSSKITVQDDINTVVNPERKLDRSGPGSYSF